MYGEGIVQRTFYKVSGLIGPERIPNHLGGFEVLNQFGLQMLSIRLDRHRSAKARFAASFVPTVP